MYFVSGTRLRLRSLWFLPAFMKSNNAVIKQLKISGGFAGGKELMDKGLVFWTLNIWEQETDMKVFRISEPHRKGMQKLPDWCNEATYAHWLQEDKEFPEWSFIYDKMIAEGKVSKVRNPSEKHVSKSFPPIKWKKTGRAF